jgi:hypothetical protein
MLACWHGSDKRWAHDSLWFSVEKSAGLAVQKHVHQHRRGIGVWSIAQAQFESVGITEIITDVREIERADVILDILEEAQEKVILSRSSTGTVREYTLRARVRFKLRTRDGFDLIPSAELLQEREISFNETAALSKESEEQLLYRDMRSDLVQQMIRRLAAARLP